MFLNASFTKQNILGTFFFLVTSAKNLYGLQYLDKSVLCTYRDQRFNGVLWALELTYRINSFLFVLSAMQFVSDRQFVFRISANSVATSIQVQIMGIWHHENVGKLYVSIEFPFITISAGIGRTLCERSTTTHIQSIYCIAYILRLSIKR